MIGDGRAEGLSFLRIRNALIETASNDPAGDAADIGPCLVERLRRELEPLPGGREHLRRRHVHTIEHHLRGVACTLPEFVFVLSNGQTLRVTMNDECADTA